MNINLKAEHFWLLALLKQRGPRSYDDIVRAITDEPDKNDELSLTPWAASSQRKRLRLLKKWLQPKQVLLAKKYLIKQENGFYEITEQGLLELERHQQGSSELALKDSSASVRVKTSRRKVSLWLKLLLVLLLLFVLALVWELNTSRLSAMFFHTTALKMTYAVEPGENNEVYFPSSGPYDQRLGYTRIPQLLKNLKTRDYHITRQAKLSAAHAAYVKSGFYPIYHEKNQTGLSIIDRNDQLIFDAKHPSLLYEKYEDIPEVIVKTLVFIEDKKLMDSNFPYRNPAVEWTRLTRAVFEKGLNLLLKDRGVPGGSTLATQIEKFRHTPHGLTTTPRDKFVQIVSASIRAYQHDETTLQVRKDIALTYINSVPLGAIPVFGEVIGLGNALQAWYGTDIAEANRVLTTTQDLAQPDAELAIRAKIYKQILSLFLAQRRPAHYLQTNTDNLIKLTERYLKILPKAGVISPEFAEAVRASDLHLNIRSSQKRQEHLSFLERKAANAIRIHLLNRLGLNNLYELDRFDMKVTSTIDSQAQKTVTDLLKELRDPKKIDEFELNEPRLLEKGDPAQVHYSFVLMERQGSKHALRVQTDSLDGPFNINESGKLELGSTAKLRVLVNYLQIMEKIYLQYAESKTPDLSRLDRTRLDPLSLWVLSYLSREPGHNLSDLLKAALERQYSASPMESFFTGGGVHRFSNFQSEDDKKIVPVIEALRNSINLPFVRIMRDIVAYELQRLPEYPDILRNPLHPARSDYLKEFIDKESQQYLVGFYKRYRDKSAEEISALLLQSMALHSRSLAIAYRSLHPEGTLEDMQSYLAARLPKALPLPTLRKLYQDYSPDNSLLSLNDRAYIANIHPIELWLAVYLYQHEQARYSELVEQSQVIRQESYQWLIDARDKTRQNSRLQVILETKAFKAIHQSWEKLGFPFTALIPTYASALGSSGDRPSALAELIGIIQNQGQLSPSIRIPEIRIAEGTPYETILEAQTAPAEQVMSRAVAEISRSALIEVVEDGTGRRVKDLLNLPPCGKVWIGGKTGTGDNRYRVSSPGKQAFESKIINRTATFVFFIGDKYFGSITAYVPSGNASAYAFTSALPVHVLKLILPRIMPAPLAFDSCPAT